MQMKDSEVDTLTLQLLKAAIIRQGGVIDIEKTELRRAKSYTGFSAEPLPGGRIRLRLVQRDPKQTTKDSG